MNSQNTPVHIKLWHREFWLLVLCNLVLTISAYVFIPVLPQWMFSLLDATPCQVSWAMAVYGIGLFAFGPFCSYLIEEYRRNKVCLFAMTVLLVSMALLYYVPVSAYKENANSIFILYFLRFLMGASFGLAQMVLCSTLIIDICESYQRTEANFATSWFGRFALSLGPLLALIIYNGYHFRHVILVAIAAVAVAMLMIHKVTFPFRAPGEDVRIFSCDRFFLPQGGWLFLNLLLITISMGLVLSLRPTILFYAMIMAGFLLALLSQRFVFENAELKSEVISGLILLGAGILMLFSSQPTAENYLSPLVTGLGIGLSSSRFLLFFIKLSRHCKRGTSQSSFMLAWESGLAIGLALGFGCFMGQRRALLLTSLALIIIALVFYTFFVHRWFMRHKNR